MNEYVIELNKVLNDLSKVGLNKDLYDILGGLFKQKKKKRLLVFEARCWRKRWRISWRKHMTNDDL